MGRLRVVGTASENASPDKIKVFMNLTAENQTADLTNKDFNKKTDLLNSILDSLGFSGLVKTENFVIDKNFKWENNKQVEDGYKATADLTLVIDLDYDKLEDLIDKVSSSLGIKVTYDAMLEEGKALEDKVISLAIEDATSKAKLISQKAGVTLTELVEISYKPCEEHFEARALCLAPSEDIVLTKSVVMVWEFK